MSRHQSRVLAFQALYAWEASGRPERYVPDFSWVEKESDILYPRLLVLGCIENFLHIDGVIKEHLKRYEIERLGKVELAIMRLGVYELTFQSDVDPAVCIHEAVRIAQDFGSGVSFRIVNGVLDAVRRTAIGPEK